MKTTKTETKRQYLIDLFVSINMQCEKAVLDRIFGNAKLGTKTCDIIDSLLDQDFNCESSGYFYSNLVDGVYSSQAILALYKAIQPLERNIKAIEARFEAEEKARQEENKPENLSKTAVRNMLVSWKKASIGDKRLLCKIQNQDGSYTDPMEWSEMLKTVGANAKLCIEVYGWAYKAPLEITHNIEVNADLKVC